MLRLAKWFGWGLLGLIASLIVATLLTAKSADPSLWPPRPDSAAVEVNLVSHGYHSGLVISRATLADIAQRQGNAALAEVARRFAAYPLLEIGWGDEGFYRHVPDAASLTIGLALRALFRPGNASVVHVVGLSDGPQAAFPSSDIVTIGLSSEGFSRLLHQLDASFARVEGQPVALGAGLYGPSQFFRGVDTFHIFNVCNHWVARLLSSAGLPTASVLATLPAGLLLDLRWRAGLSPLPRL